jgi:hypothetical protein
VGLTCALSVAAGCGGATADHAGGDGGLSDAKPSDASGDATLQDGGDAGFDASSTDAGPCAIDSAPCLGCVSGNCAQQMGACQYDDSGLGCPEKYLVFKMCVCNVEDGVTSSDPAALDDCELEFQTRTQNGALVTCIGNSCASECLPPSGG